MEDFKRTNTCGDLRKDDEAKAVILNGWVHKKREHGGITFLNLRDRYGETQVVIDPQDCPNLASFSSDLKSEFCIAVKGLVSARPQSMVNPNMQTGEIEVLAKEIEVLSASETPPFVIDEKTNASEELRLKYRYLDLRSAMMQKHIILRSKVTFATRQFLTERGFLEIETPTFIASTPEGARDYLVPSRLHPGQFFALPQSPQLYKQILMVAGFDKYFQIARCYRDEDARGDRQPEFTQIDIEMSFVSRDDVLDLTEDLMRDIFKKTLDVDLPSKFNRLSYEDAMNFYGTDKPDLRFDLKLQNAEFLTKDSDFQAFNNVVSSGGAIKALVVPGAADSYSRKKIEELEDLAKIYKARGLAWMKVGKDANDDVQLEGGISKFFATRASEIISTLNANVGDLLLFIADAKVKTAAVALGAVRSKLGKDLNLLDNKKFEFVWIVDFPMFEWNEDENKWDTAHHMFTWPQDQYHDVLESDPGSVKGDQYDLVLNGYELASGSIRIHNPDLQNKIFKIVGFSEEEANKRFGFLTEAFKYGAPPHGGIAPGLDRLIMIMAGQSSIKEVIAFPKNSFAQNLMDNSPGFVSDKQLEELHINIVK